jgi:hypothetical protein
MISLVVVILLVAVAFSAGVWFGRTQDLRANFRIRRREALRRVKQYESREVSKMRS